MADKRAERVQKHEASKGKRRGTEVQVDKNKLFNESNNTLVDGVVLMEHGLNVEKKIGRPLKFATDEIMKQEIFEYFQHCQDTCTIPTVLGVSLWLGVTRETVYQWTREDFPYTDTIKNTMSLIHKFTEDNAILGNINPVLYFFMAKNYWGMRDSTETIIRPENNRPSESEQRAIIDALPPTD